MDGMEILKYILAIFIPVRCVVECSMEALAVVVHMSVVTLGILSLYEVRRTRNDPSLE